MAFRIANVRLGLDEPEASLAGQLAKVLGLRPEDLLSWRILRKSLDARVKENLNFVYTAEVTLAEADEEDRLRALGRKRHTGEVRIYRHQEASFVPPAPGKATLMHRPVIVGSGPAGLVAGFFLAQQGYAPLILERGPAVHQRIKDVQAFDAGGAFNPESNYLFGEGGAGTFSDGKLTCRSSGPEVRRVLELFAECKGKPSILYDYRPHLGSNRLPAVVKALRRRIEAKGGEIRFGCQVLDLELDHGKDGVRVRGAATTQGRIPAEVVMLAIGHSARDTLTMLMQRGLPMVRKAFQMGVRLEQPQEIVNRVKYGKAALEEKLGAADYNLVARGDNDLFSFCMCAGGYIIPSVSEPGYFCTNGMSLSGRDSPFANSGLVITVPPAAFGGQDLLVGVRLQQEYERRAFELGRGDYMCPIQNAGDFLANRSTDRLPPCSYRRGLVLAQIEELIPPIISRALRHGLPILDHRWHGRYLTQATLVAPETRGSSPVCMLRDDVTRQSPGWLGVFPVGEGAGYAGGIVSAAVDGLRSAVAIIENYAPLRAGC
jgi:uncharacterized protein